MWERAWPGPSSSATSGCCRTPCPRAGDATPSPTVSAGGDQLTKDGHLRRLSKNRRCVASCGLKDMALCGQTDVPNEGMGCPATVEFKTRYLCFGVVYDRWNEGVRGSKLDCWVTTFIRTLSSTLPLGVCPVASLPSVSIFGWHCPGRPTCLALIFEHISSFLTILF